MKRSHRLSLEALETRDLLAVGLTTYLALDDPRGTFVNTTAKFNEFVATLGNYGVDTIEGYAGFTPDPTLTFGSTGITSQTDVNFVAAFPALAVSGNNSLYDQGPPSAGGPDVPDVFTFNTLITAFGMFLSNTGDGPADTLTFVFENTITGASKTVVAGTFGPSASYDNVIFFGVTDTDPFNRVTMKQSYDYDGSLLDNITAGYIAVSANAGGPYSVSEGSSLNLNANPGGGAVPTNYLYSWDVNGDGVFGDATGVAPTLSWSQLTALGISDGPATRNVRVRITDSLGSPHDSSPVMLTINNVAPTASLSIPALGLRTGGQAGNAVRGQSSDYVLTAVDHSANDQAAGYTFTIDWDGNGTTDQTVVGSSGITVQHAFATSATYNVRVKATDKDGGVSAIVQQSVKVVDWDLRPNANDSALTDLVWGGSTGNDSIEFAETAAATILVKTLVENGVAIGIEQTITGVTAKVIAYAQAGNDQVVAIALASTAIEFHGGLGSDTLRGGMQNDRLLGEEDIDHIFGHVGDDSIDGGAGADFLYGEWESPPKETVHGHDTIYGGEGDDVIYGDGDGGEGTSDVLYGGAGNDTIIGDGAEGDATGLDTIFGGDGNDLIVGESDGAEGAADQLFGESGNDIIHTGGGNDLADGGADDDILLGGSGDNGAADTLLGGTGRDILVGDGGEPTTATVAGGIDSLNGGTGEDLLIASKYLPATVDSMVAIFSEWTSSRPFAQRVANIQGTGVGPRNNGSDFLIAGGTVTDDEVIDTVFAGGSDKDWAFVKVTQDVTPDLGSEDILSGL